MEPGLIAASERQALDAVHARYAPVNIRVAAILENIRCDCRQLASETRNRGNERQVEEFIARLSAEVGNRAYEVSRRGGREPVGPEDARRWEAACRRNDAPCVVIERQRLSAVAVRTTRWNCLFTVPGASEDRVVLVAHYDTWRGPGADDNTTGEEILKQYLLADLRAGRRPALTHTYFMAGSEECGLVGLTSQILLALGLQAANLALTQQDWLYGALAVALAPLASYRFGVSGSREYVKTLSADELRRIRGVVSGKASPIVFGGKIYTPRDTPDRVYPEPLRETLLILDYFFHRLEGGTRVGEPRFLDEFHYARLYRAGDGHLLALKDAVEHNRRNVNGVYRVKATIDGARAVAHVQEMVGWGVETRLRDQVADTCARLGLSWERERIAQLEVIGDGTRLHFARKLGPWRRLAQLYHRAVAACQAVVRRFIFVTFFVLAYVLAQAFGWAFDVAFDLSPRFAIWVASHTTVTLVAVVVTELAILLYLMARRIPTWIDNGYRHENRADNLGSLRRVRE